MAETISIIKNSKLSVDSVDVERSLLFDIDRTTSNINAGDIKSTIDLNEQYLKERNACNDYRLILTIKPYCTNVLFNACTEVVMNEGSDDTDAVLFDEPVDTKTLNKIKSQIKGKNNNIKVYDMIRNTEYSREGIGFEYHPGLDIFNNHIIRNKSYRIVNDYSSSSNRDDFNTISDLMRDSSGTVLKRCCRKTIEDTTMGDRHLYDKDDIFPFYTGEAITENLREQDGWFGFYNTSVISAKNRAGVDMDISRIINNKGNCEFIDMYPDRTLFSFVPKYNKYRNRLEYNWEYAITYAFDNTTSYTYRTTDDQGHEICLTKDFELVQSGNANALATIKVEYRRLPNGSGAVFFRSATKHNLKPMDKVYIYFNPNEAAGNGNWRKSCHTYLVDGVGDINHKNEEYYFYITNLDLLEEIFCTPFMCDINPTQIDYTYSSWDYVRDYFYDVYEPDQIDEFDGTKTYVPGQLVRVPGGNVYVKYEVGETIPKGSKYYVRNGNTYTLDHSLELPHTILPGEEYYRNNENDDVVYITIEKHTGQWDASDFEVFNNNHFIEYPETGLTNIPSEMDKFIIVKDYVSYSLDSDSPHHWIQPGETYYTKNDDNTYTSHINDTGTPIAPTEWGEYFYYDDIKYILCNHDRDIIYDGSVDCDTFIRAIINNAFTETDNYGSDIEVNPSMLGLYRDYIAIRFVKTNGNYNCSYYVRKFKQIPGSSGITLDKESYQLAFSNTIYGDSVVQSVFTDNINVNGLKDNLGRDLTEVFLTIIKTNKGHDKWYGTTNGPVSDVNNDNVIYNDPDIEYSHCFGQVTCGFELSQESNDTANIRATRRDLIDVTLINNFENLNTIPNCPIDDGFTTADIKITDSWFYGDVVEFCPWTCEETVISDVCFRFNTAQRELTDDGDAGFRFDEILTDDFDDDGFKICTYKVSNIINRNEGYYYKAHYRIPLRDLSPVIQDSHSYLSVLNAIPIQVDGIYILVKTSLRHNLFQDSKVLLRDTTVYDTPEWWLDVVYIVDDYSFVMKTIDNNDINYRDWVAICINLNNKAYTLRAKNPNIPDKAARLGVNTYLWREAVGVLDMESESPIASYVFANNSIYVDNSFNFYLKRQDPYNVNGLYFDGSQCTITCDDSDCTEMNTIDKWFIADVESKADTSESKFEYNEEEYTAQC